MRFSFLLKRTPVVALVALFDRLFSSSFSGARIGTFAGTWMIGLVLGRRDIRRSSRAWIALAAAALIAASLFDEPGSLALTLFWCALSVAALLPKAGRFDDAWRWGASLLIHAVARLGKPFADLRRSGASRRRPRAGPRAVMAMLGLPRASGNLFHALFAAANPQIAQALAVIRLPSIRQTLLRALVAVCVWPSLRPPVRHWRLTLTKGLRLSR